MQLRAFFQQMASMNFQPKVKQLQQLQISFEDVLQEEKVEEVKVYNKKRIDLNADYIDSAEKPKRQFNTITRMVRNMNT